MDRRPDVLRFALTIFVQFAKRLTGTVLAMAHNQYPQVRVRPVVQPLSATDFEAQSHKHLSRQAAGGAIGVIRMTDDQIVLVKRRGMHAGWALPGGTVERGEDFEDAFAREVD